MPSHERRRIPRRALLAGLGLGVAVVTGCSEASTPPTPGDPTRSPVGDCTPEPFTFGRAQRCPRGDVGAPVPESSRFLQPLAISPDGALVASAYQDGRVLWRTDTGEVDRVLGPAGASTLLAWSPDAHELVSNDCDGNLLRTEAVCGGRIGVLDGHRAPDEGLVATTGLAFSSDGRALYSVGSDETLRAWSVADGSQLASLSVPERAWALAASPDGEHLVVSHEGGAVVVATSDLSILAERPLGEEALFWAFAADDTLVVTRSGDTPLLLGLDGADERELWAGTDGVERVIASPVGGTLAGRSRTKVWLGEASGPPTQLASPTGDTLVDVAFSPDGNTLYGVFEAAGVCAWDVASPGEPRFFATP